MPRGWRRVAAEKASNKLSHGVEPWVGEQRESEETSVEKIW
jgi:hypothetical protein